MQYAIYKKIRNAAWQCLIDCNVNTLPVPVGDIVHHYGFKTISDCELLHNGESGRLIILDGQPIIVVRDSESKQRIRFTMLHELAHYLLGHLGSSSELSRSYIREPQEQEADMFAARVLMPACVLWALNAHTPQEIAYLCDVSIQAATHRAERLAILTERGMFLTSPDERRVYQLFENYIKTHKN